MKEGYQYEVLVTNGAWELARFGCDEERPCVELAEMLAEKYFSGCTVCVYLKNTVIKVF